MTTKNDNTLRPICEYCGKTMPKIGRDRIQKNCDKEIYGERGYTWRYVPNERISSLKLEKVINKDLHLDTDQEKAAKIQALIDKGQDDRISANREAIDKINGK
jgi:hypothetical protein